MECSVSRRAWARECLPAQPHPEACPTALCVRVTCEPHPLNISWSSQLAMNGTLASALAYDGLLLVDHQKAQCEKSCKEQQGQQRRARLVALGLIDRTRSVPSELPLPRHAPSR